MLYKIEKALAVSYRSNNTNSKTTVACNKYTIKKEYKSYCRDNDNKQNDNGEIHFSESFGE